MSAYDTAVFDMDGTVLDSARGLCEAMNHAMGATGHRHDFAAEQMKHLFGSGVQVAVTRALAVEGGVRWDERRLVDVGTPRQDPSLPVDAAEVAVVQAVFDPYYTAHCDKGSSPFPGVLLMLSKLRAHGVKCAVVSNKSADAVDKLVRDLFPHKFDAWMGVHSGMARKPAADMVLATLKRLGTTPERSVYVGDTEVDRQTAENSGMDCVSVDWGFRSHGFLEGLGARMIASTPDDVLAYVLHGQEKGRSGR